MVTDPKVKQMRFKSYRSFEKTCVGLDDIKKTLRYNFDKMRPIIERNLQSTEYLLVEPKRQQEMLNLEGYKSLKQYIRDKRQRDQNDFIQRRMELETNEKRQTEFNVKFKGHSMPKMHVSDYSYNPRVTKDMSSKIKLDMQEEAKIQDQESRDLLQLGQKLRLYAHD